MRLAAVLWLLVVSPLDLATGLARLLSRPGPLPPLAIALVLLRLLVAALGLVLGQRLVQRASGLLAFAWRWAAADLGTLAAVLATGALPTSRPPGTGPIVWVVYAGLALLVVAAARVSAARSR